MKIAVIGTGKTGGEVVNLINEKDLVGPFNLSHKPTVKALQKADAVIIFVPGSAVDDILQTVMDAGTPAIWGSTGYPWPADLEDKLKQKKLKWLKASNFSLGMNIVRRCIALISKGSELMDEPEFHIHEVHHTDKLDAPSGTAISWKEWLHKPAEITSERKGDIKGIHQLHMKTKPESIWLKHQAHERAVFAKGAIWAAGQLLKDSVDPGFYTIETIFDKALTASI